MTNLTVSKKTSRAIAVQELSIQWLSLNRIQKYTKIPKEKMPTTELGKLVQRIMDVYKKSKREDDGKVRHFECLDYAFESTHNYELQVYGRVEEMSTALSRELKEGGVDEEMLPKKTFTEFLLFFFRKTPYKEIVAASSGTAWEVIRPCVNYAIPVAIAGRILDPHRISEITRRCLLGNDIKETLYNPSGRELYKTSNVYYLVESFKCRVKSNSSLINLPFFDDSPPEIIIRSGLLRVKKRIALMNYPLLLAYFSEHIHADRRPTEIFTYNANGKIETFDRDFEFLHFLTPVPSSRDKLDQEAVTQIFHAYQNNRRQRFSFRHKFLQDFLETNCYEIQFKKNSRFKPLSSKPESIEELLNELFELDEASVSSEKAIQKVFAQGILRYHRRDGVEVSDPLIEFVEGEVRDENGNIYFRIRGMWYKLAVDFQALLHEDYRNLLRQVLIKPKEEGQLPKPWRGNKLQGQLTESGIRKEVGISKGLRTFMGELKKARVCFVDEKENVKHPKLVGEILDTEVICRNKRKYQEVIDKEILSKEKLPEQERLKELFQKDAKEIVNELKKKRRIVKEEGKKSYVVNPLPYPLKSTIPLLGKYDAFASFLQKLHQSYVLGVESEEDYNRAYLNSPYGLENGYLVFDQICPHNIEPCDILYFTEETTYLYHVKETLGQHTRDACSQILNAAKEFRSALSTYHEDNYLQLLWKIGTGQFKSTETKENSSWKNQLKEALERLGEESFYSIFRDRKVVFVYAFLEHDQKSIHEETRIKVHLSAEDLGLKEKPQTYQRLKELHFLDRAGRLTGKFYATNKERFVGADPEFSEELYKQMCTYSPTSDSTLAKIELLDTVKEIRALGFEFKICQIQRPQDDHTDENIHCNPPSSNLSLPDELADTAYEEPGPVPTVIENGPIGFRNVGNSCYINAVLQALFNVPSIRNCINSVNDTASPCMSALKQVLQKDAPPTRALLENFRNLVFGDEENTLEGIGQQQDAHEFLRFVLDKLNWKPITLFNRYEVNQEMHNSQTEEPTHHLSVPIDAQGSFQGALDNFFAFGLVEADENPFEVGNVSVTEWQQASCIKAPAPDDLIVHLKRFRNDGSKNNTFLSFPEDGKVSIEDENGDRIIYEIVAFINHIGNTSKSGHYTADVRNFQDPQGLQQWIHCDDHKLVQRPPSNPGEDAYIVVLKKCG